MRIGVQMFFNIINNYSRLSKLNAAGDLSNPSGFDYAAKQEKPSLKEKHFQKQWHVREVLLSAPPH